jgi:hypothetical protein
LKPLLRRVWAPIGQRPIVLVQHRFAWHYLVGCVYPASGRTCFHLATIVSIPVIEVELAEFAYQVGANPQKQIVLVLGSSCLTVSFQEFATNVKVDFNRCKVGSVGCNAAANAPRDFGVSVVCRVHNSVVGAIRGGMANCLECGHRRQGATPLP